MSEPIDNREMPQDRDNEMATLGSMLAEADCIDEVSSIITNVNAFYTPAHRDIWRAILSEHAAGHPMDWLLFKDVLQGHTSDPLNYIVTLSESFSDVANAGMYAKKVQECYRRRQLIGVADEIATLAYSQATDAIDLAETFRAKLDAITLGSAATTATVEIREAFDRLQASWAAKRPEFIPTGLAAMDATYGGLALGEQTILAARPSVGKTAFGIACLAHAATQGHSGLMYSIEMQSAKIAERMLSNLTGDPASRVHYTQSPDDWRDCCASATLQLGDGRVWINDRLNTAKAIVADARLAIRRHGVRLIVVDFAQLLQTPGRENPNIEIGRVATSLKALAQEEMVCVLMLSQLNRAADTDDKPPRLGQLRDSGVLEQAADSVWFLHRTSPPDGRSTDTLSLIISKNRNGKTGRIENVQFDKPAMQFAAGAG